MEIRAYQEGRAKKLGGYSARYNKLSCELSDGRGGKFREKILPGAFDGMDSRDVADHSSDCECSTCGILCLLNHDPTKVLGRVGARTLTLTPDKKGLKFEVTLPDTQYANDLYEQVERGDVRGCSFGFSTADVQDSWSVRDETDEFVPDDRSIISKVVSAVKKFVLRTISKFQTIHEVTITSMPAYAATSVSARSLAAATELRARLGLEVRPTLDERIGLVHLQETNFKRKPGLAEDAPRRARALNAAIQFEPTGPWPMVDGTGLVDIILEARKLAAKTELNTIEHRRFWFCVDAVTKLKKGFGLGNLEHEYRKELLAQLVN